MDFEYLTAKEIDNLVAQEEFRRDAEEEEYIDPETNRERGW